MISPREGLTYDDVLLEPKRRRKGLKRSDVSLKTQLSKNISLNLPIISANMDTVTEHQMAIALALYGGTGVIHRFLPIEKQTEEIFKVKRFMNIVIENPYSILWSKTLREAKILMKKYEVSGLLVVNEGGVLIGILTSKDIELENNEDKLVSQLMTKNPITAKPDIDFNEAMGILDIHKIEKLPLVAESNKPVGLITRKDILRRAKFPNASVDSKGRLIVGGAIGVVGAYLERAQALVSVGCDFLVIDIAHGHADDCIEAVEALKNKFKNIDLIAGNVATAEGTEDLIKAGADAVKVGVGPGSTCTTRLVSGSGVPQLTAVIECAQKAKEFNIPVIADGGIKHSGDIVKALAAGASSVMIGRLFAGVLESPGYIDTGADERKYKFFRGMASREANLERILLEGASEEEIEEIFNRTPEGVIAKVPYIGPVADKLKELAGGLRSGMTYQNASNISELQTNPVFVKTTLASQIESKPHDVEI